ncbi:hypothetical protein ACTU3I_05335 [Microbacterium sp. RD1]|uniref:hypothetical protein n=1 Tax=Microbacterium sp. RD1 TaxID=3457313 RepID=UPI003FA5809C
MTQRLFVLDVPENVPIVETASQHPEVTLDRIGPYFVLSADGTVSVDRRSTGARHAVWYSWIGGIKGWRIEAWNGNELRLVPR